MPPRKDRPVVDGKLCGAQTRKGSKCKNPAGAGTDHFGYGRCKNHTGSTPAGRLSAAKQEMEERHAQALAYGVDAQIETDPHQALIDEVGRTAGHVRWLMDKIGIGEEGELVQETDKGDVAAIWLQLYQAERAHLVRVSKTAIDCGVAERQVRIAEQQGALLAGAVRLILERLDLTDAQLEAAPGVVRGVLLEFAQFESKPPALPAGQTRSGLGPVEDAVLVDEGASA